MFAVSSKVRNKILSLLTSSFPLGKRWYFCLLIGAIPNKPISRFFAFALGPLAVKLPVFLRSCNYVTLKQKGSSPFCWATLLWKNESISTNLLCTWCLLSSLGGSLWAATPLSLPSNAMVPKFLHTFWVLCGPLLLQPVFAHLPHQKLWCGRLS